MNEIDDRFDLDITGLDHADVLMALYNEAKPLGLGKYEADGNLMTKGEASVLLEKAKTFRGGWFDYVKGRPLKVQFDGNVLRRYDLYDRDQGHGKAKIIIDGLKVAR